MTVVNPHTTRAVGTILTAVIYNYDHQNHVNNALALEALIGATGPLTASQRAVWIPAQSMYRNSGSAVPPLNLANVGGGLPTVLNSADYDSTTEEYLYFWHTFDRAWDLGQISYKLVWSHAATTVNFGIQFDLYASALPDSASMAVSAGSPGSVSDTGGSTDFNYISSESNLLTVLGTLTPDMPIVFRLNRVPAFAGDTMAIDARVQGIILIYSASDIAGPAGLTGPQGARGKAGVSVLGTDGEDGTQGPPGRRGLPGAVGPAGTKGRSIIGPPGADGEDGQDGLPGRRGLTGLPGLTGPKGRSVPGFTGDEGEIGNAGPPGRRGLTGPSGPTGAQGPAGFRKTVIIDSDDGDTGPIGPRGLRGLAGPQGPAGITGAAGFRRTVFFDAPEGDQGERGPPGTRGKAGTGTATRERMVSIDTIFPTPLGDPVSSPQAVLVNIPNDWDLGPIRYQLVWQHAPTTVNFGVRFSLKSVSVPDGTTPPPTFPGISTDISDIGGIDATYYITPKSALFTVDNLVSAEEPIWFQITRDNAHVSDTLAADVGVARLLLYYTSNNVAGLPGPAGPAGDIRRTIIVQGSDDGEVGERGPPGRRGPAGTPGGGGGSANVGTAVLDFGAFPGKSDASVAVTGQTTILVGSVVRAWIRPNATADHSVDEHVVESIGVFAHTVVAGTGFTIYGINTSETNEPTGIGTRVYGQWSVGWEWN